MVVGLCAVGFKSRDIVYNKNRIIELIHKYSGKLDLLFFGETFLQGFDSPSWNYEEDKLIAIGNDDPIINEIKEKAKECSIAVSFGYIERCEDSLYSSQMTINKNGEIIDVFHRVSIGWKEKIADYHYKEGNDFHLFKLNGKSFAIGLCGDMWDDGNIKKMKDLKPDIVLWPVYLDYNYNEWNNEVKYDYAHQSSIFANKVLCVNSVCLDKDEIDTAKGGAIYFENGIIKYEIPAGKENVLIVEL